MTTQNYIYNPTTTNVNNATITDMCEKMINGSKIFMFVKNEVFEAYKVLIYKYFDARVDAGDFTRKDVKNLLNKTLWPTNTSSAYWTKKRVAERVALVKEEFNVVEYSEVDDKTYTEQWAEDVQDSITRLVNALS